MIRSIGKTVLLFWVGVLLGVLLFEFPVIIVVTACLCVVGLTAMSIYKRGRS